MQALSLRSTLAAAAFALAITGCATKVAGLKQSPTFTFPNITQGKMAVGGVAASSGILDEGKRTSYANLLRTELLEERKEYNIAPVGSVVNRLGRPQYQTIISELQNTGTISDQSLAVLRNKMADTRYVTFALIEHDEVTNDRRETSSTDKNGKVIEGSEKVISSAARNVTASLHVYDLKGGDVAFTGAVTKSLSDSRQYDKENEMGLVSVIKAIKGDAAAPTDSKYPYPTAPDTMKVLAKVFSGFGENLPKAD
jgi:hypothetical protein